MGLTDASAPLLVQTKKGQGETNERLDALIAEQRRANQLLEWLGELLQGQGASLPR